MTGVGLKPKEKQAFPNILSSPVSRRLFPKAWNMKISLSQCKFTFLTSQQVSTCNLVSNHGCKVVPTTFLIFFSWLLKTSNPRIRKMASSCTWWKQSWKGEVPPAPSVLFREIQSWFNTEIFRLNTCAYARKWGDKPLYTVATQSPQWNLLIPQNTKVFPRSWINKAAFILNTNNRQTKTTPTHFIAVVWVTPQHLNSKAPDYFNTRQRQCHPHQLAPIHTSPLAALQAFPPGLRTTHHSRPCWLTQILISLSKVLFHHLMQIPTSSGSWGDRSQGSDKRHLDMQQNIQHSIKAGWTALAAPAYLCENVLPV